MKKRLLIFILLLAGTANATHYYVKPDGNNGSAGTSWATAWAHPNKALGTISSGDTLEIAPNPVFYDTVYIDPPNAATAWTVYACSSFTTNPDAGRSNTILSAAIELTAGWTNRSGNIWRYNATLPPRWNSLQDYNVVVTQGDSLSGGKKSSLGGTVDTWITASGMHWYDEANDSLFFRPFGDVDPNTVAIRASISPLFYAGSTSEGAVKIIGLGLYEAQRGPVWIGSSDMSGSSDAPDSIWVLHCNIRYGGDCGPANNPGLVYGGFSSGAPPSTANAFANFLQVRACSLQYCKSPDTDYSGGAAFDSYVFSQSIFDSNYIENCKAGGFMFKYGGGTSAAFAFANVIAFNTIIGGRAAIWAGPRQDSLMIYGNIIGGQTYQGITIYSTGSNVPYHGRMKIFNNTFVTSPGSSGYNILISPIAESDSGMNEVRYNVTYQGSTGNTIGFDVLGGEAAAQTPVTETHWEVDSNMYYRTSGSFVCHFSDNNGSCSGTGFSDWQSCLGGYDVHSSATTNPNFNNVGAGDYSRPSASGEMNRTYGGRTWGIYGAIQNGLSITDSCIQITGKITFSESDTCYCVVDSLKYTFAQWDTLINTGGHDNIRIWGYHNGGGRGIIGYSASDTGSNATVTDLQKGSVVLHVEGGDDVTIGNLAIVPRTIDDSVRGIVCVNALTVDGINLDNDSIVAGGFSSRAYQQSTTGGNRSFNQLLQNSYLGTVSKGYHRRDALYGATIKFTTSVLKSDRYSGAYQYAYKVRNCRINTIHTGIGSAGFTVDTTPTPDDTLYPLIYIDSNTITVDCRNDLFMTYDDNDVNNSAGDPYGIGVDGVDRGSRITGNSISSMASTHYGGDGMLLQHIDATVDTPFAVYNNTFALQHGAHPRIAEGRQAVVGTYIRNYDANYFVKGLWYHHNYGYLVVDEDTTTTYAGRYGECVRMGFENGANGNIIEKNHFTLVPRDSLTRTGAGNLEVSGLTFEQHDSTNSAGDAGTGNNVARYNYWRVPRNPIWLGGTRIGIGADNVHIIGDTCNTIYDGDSTFVRFHQSGTYYSHSINNDLQDMVLQGYANVSDVIKGTVTASADSLGKQLSYLRSLTVNLKDASSVNVSGASIWAIDAYGHRFNMPNSNASGNSSDTLRWRFFGYDALPADGYVVADSNSYNNFTFWGKSGSDSASTSATINWTTSQLINVQLSSSASNVNDIFRGVVLKGTVIK